MSRESGKAYLEKQMKAVMRIYKVGEWLAIIGGILGLGSLLGIFEAILYEGIFGLHFTIELVFLMLPSPVLILLGLCIRKYYDDKHTVLVEEWKRIEA